LKAVVLTLLRHHLAIVFLMKDKILHYTAISTAQQHGQREQSTSQHRVACFVLRLQVTMVQLVDQLSLPLMPTV
jgi:hypothetical protein